MIRLGHPSSGLLRSSLVLEILFAFRCFFYLLANRIFDVVHCLHYSDACAARIAGRITGTPYLYHMLGIAVRRAYLRRPIDYLLLTTALRGARANISISQFAARFLKNDFGLASAVIPPPCDLNKFRPVGDRDLQHPVFLASGAFSEPRKGFRVLLQAFEMVKRHVPAAELHVSGHINPEQLRYLEAAPPRIHSSTSILGAGDAADLPRLYSSAAVTVLPSMWEAFGMVLAESLACGTPVVGTRHGGIPEVIGEGVGMLFDPGSAGSEATNSEGLAQAMIHALALHADPHIGDRCRAAAREFSVESYLAKLEDLHRLCAPARQPVTA